LEEQQLAIALLAGRQVSSLDGNKHKINALNDILHLRSFF
jgi:hypothetical protein